MKSPIIIERRVIPHGPLVLSLHCAGDWLNVIESDEPLSAAWCQRIAEFIQRHAPEAES